MTKTTKRSPLFEWRTALQQSHQPLSVKTTLLLLADYADNNTLLCWPGQAELCEKAGRSRSAMAKRLQAALESGWLEREKKGHTGRNTRYRLVFGPAESVSKTSKECVEKSVSSPTESVSKTSKSVSKTSKECIKNDTPTTHEHTLETTHHSEGPSSTEKEPTGGRGQDKEKTKEMLVASIPSPSFSSTLITIFPARPDAAWPGSRAAMHAGHRNGFTDEQLRAAYVSFVAAHPTLTYMRAEAKFIAELSVWVEKSGSVPVEPAAVVEAVPVSGSRSRSFTSPFLPPLPDDFEPSDSERRYATARGVDIGVQVQRLRKWLVEKPRRGDSWDSMLRTFVVNAAPVEMSDDELMRSVVVNRGVRAVAKELGVEWTRPDDHPNNGSSPQEQAAWRSEGPRTFLEAHGDAVAELVGVA